MGIVKHLLLWPVTGPLALTRFAVRQIEGVVRRELTDDEQVKEDLMALQMELELGDIDEAEYERREGELMERLRAAREWRVELGMEEEWAPLGLVEERGEEGSSGSADEVGGDESWSRDSSSASPPDSSSS